MAKGGGFYGYKLSLGVCARTDLPVAWRVETARAHEASLADDLLQAVRERVQPETVAMDKGYDTQPIHDACHEAGCLPIIPLKKTPTVVAGKHKPPECEHGTWTFAGADEPSGTRASGAVRPASVSRSRRRVKASRLHPLIPRESKRWGDLYRGRASVERAFGRLKNEGGLAPLRVRGLERVALHADLCILATLASALARARAVPLAA